MGEHVLVVGVARRTTARASRERAAVNRVARAGMNREARARLDQSRRPGGNP